MTRPDAAMAALLDTIRAQGVTDEAVLAALAATPRERFIPAVVAHRWAEDVALPIGQGQTISQPAVVAQMTQLLQPDKRLKVLEIGTGSGYQTAILCRLFRRVYSIERIAELGKPAADLLKSLGHSNLTTRIGDGMRGWPEQAPFDRIITTAAAAEPPPALIEQLAIGGILVIPLETPRGDARLVRFTRTETGLASELSWPVRFVPLLPGVAS